MSFTNHERRVIASLLKSLLISDNLKILDKQKLLPGCPATTFFIFLIQTLALERQIFK